MKAILLFVVFLILGPASHACEIWRAGFVGKVTSVEMIGSDCKLMFDFYEYMPHKNCSIEMSFVEKRGVIVSNANGFCDSTKKQDVLSGTLYSYNDELILFFEN